MNMNIIDLDTNGEIVTQEIGIAEILKMIRQTTPVKTAAGQKFGTWRDK